MAKKRIDEAIKKVKVFAMDVDGTLTDGSIYIGKDGEVMKSFDVKDGLGISLLNKSGISTAIITGRTSEIVLTRARELNIRNVIQGANRKDEALQKLADECDVSVENIAYIGDDLNDLSALLNAGVAVCPADAVSDVKECCDIVLSCNGGKGAIREFAELVLDTQGKMQKVKQDLYGLCQ